MSTKTSVKADPSPVNFSSGKFLTFRLANESYGIEVLLVREIIRMQKITPVPEMPAHIKGVINLRGKVTPVVDLRVRLGLEAGNTTDRTCVIVVDVEKGGGFSSLFGLIVDAVDEVIPITESKFGPSSNSASTASSEVCLGTANVKGGVLTLLDIDKVVNLEISGGLASL